MTSLAGDLLQDNQPEFSNKPLINFQTGKSLQRVTVTPSVTNNTSNCPCTTIINEVHESQDLTDNAFINLTMISGRFTECDLTRTNFTKSILASYAFNKCFGDSPIFYEVSLSDASFNDCSIINASWSRASLHKVSCYKTVFGNVRNSTDFSEATLDHFETNSTTKFDFCTFFRAVLKSFFVDGSSMQNCEFGYSKIDSATFTTVNLNNSSFQHAKLSRVSMTNGTTISGADFLDAFMDYVELSNMNLNGVIFDNSHLSNMDLTGSSLIATSFLGAKVNKSVFTNAILSDTANPMNNNSNVATNFQNSELTRITISGATANMRFTIFTKATISLSSFIGMSHLQRLDAREADFSDAVVMDCSFQFCNFTNTNFARSSLKRVNFVGCSLLNARIENAQLEYCTADVLTILPRNWQRDSNGWIYVYDAGPVAEEQARNEILTLGIYNNIFQNVVLNGYQSNGVYDVQLLDGTYVTAQRIRKMNQKSQNAGSYQIGTPVFVRIGANQYVHGVINSAIIKTTTFNIDFYSDVPTLDVVPTIQDQSNLFFEYFDNGSVLSVAKSTTISSPNFYVLYRAIKTVSDPPTSVIWFNGSQDDLTPPIRRLTLIQPLVCTLNQVVFVLFQENYNSDNYYTSGTIVAVNENNMYDVSVVCIGNVDNAVITKSIQDIYLETP